MQFPRAMVSPEVIGDLLVQLSLHDVLEHLKFTRCELGERRMQSGQPITLCASASVAVNRPFNDLDQLLLRCAFGEKILRAPSHCLHGARNVSMTAEKDNRQGMACL